MICNLNKYKNIQTKLTAKLTVNSQQKQQKKKKQQKQQKQQKKENFMNKSLSQTILNPPTEDINDYFSFME